MRSNLRRLIRKASPARGNMTIRGNVREYHAMRLPRLRGLVHRVLRALGLIAVLCSISNAQKHLGQVIRNEPGLVMPVDLNSTAISTGSISCFQGGTWTQQPGNIQNTTPWLTISTNTAVYQASSVPFSVSVVSTMATTTHIATGASSSIKAGGPVKSFSLLVKGTGGVPTAWDVRLEGGLDNTNFTQILAHTNLTGDGVSVFSGSAFSPSLYIRARVAGLTLAPATNIVVSILGLQ